MIERLPIYSSLPVFLQDCLCSLEGWKIEKERYGGNFSSVLHDYEKHLAWSRQNIEEYRNSRLREFVRHCFETVPYYRNLFQRLQLRPDDIQTIDDLPKLPILTKQEVQRNREILLSETIQPTKRNIASTGGTTGTPLRVVTTIESLREQRAAWWRHRRSNDLQLDTWCAFFGGRPIVPKAVTKPPFWRYNFGGHQILFSVYHLNRTNIVYYVGELRRRRPPWIHGFPSALNLLAIYMRELGMELGYQVKWLTASSESLLAHQAENIRHVFGVYPRQHYAMIEGVANFSECSSGWFHIDEDFSAVELIPYGDRRSYRVVGSNFTNFAMPLLRYDTQDIVANASCSCSCGYPGRSVSEIDGRKDDYLLLNDGTMLGRLDSIFKFVTNVREAQIYQNKHGDICIQVVRSDGFSTKDEIILINELRRYVGSDIDFRLNYVDYLTKSPSGKLRFVISELAGKQGSKFS